MAGPMFGIKRGIIFRQQRIAAVVENGFDEIQVADEIARHEAADLHGFFGNESGHGGTNQRAQQQRDETFRRLRLRGGERQFHQFARRREREREQSGKSNFWHAELVVGDRQAALGDVKNSGGRAAVAARIMQNALFDAVGIDDVGRKIIAIHRQRQHAGEAGAVERESARGQFRHRRVLQIIIEKSLDAPVGWTKMLAEEPVFLARLRGHGGGDLDKFPVALHRHGRAADEGKLDVDMGDEMRRQLAVHGDKMWLKSLTKSFVFTMPILCKLANNFPRCGAAAGGPVRQRVVWGNNIALELRPKIC